MKKILLITTGSIACFKAAQAVSRLVQKGYGVQVVATESALKFVGTATWEGLTGNPVATDLWAQGGAMDHIRLVREADLVIAAPATANFLNRMAAGLADDLASTLFLAHDFQKPFLVAPAMNAAMWRHPATRASVARIAAMGVEVLPAGVGSLACGEEGEGRLLEPEELVSRIELRLRPGGQRVLVTAGGTREPIDDVRFLGNSSTGVTGASIAAELAAEGIRVTLLRSVSAAPAPLGVESRTFTTYSDLEELLRKELSADAPSHVIHAAAVSDFTVAKREGKMPSGEERSLRLAAAPKLIARLKEWAPVRVCGFKLTSGSDEPARRDAVARVMEHSDLVVHNDLSEIAHNRHTFHLHQRQQPDETIEGAQALGRRLARWIQETRA